MLVRRPRAVLIAAGLSAGLLASAGLALAEDTTSPSESVGDDTTALVEPDDVTTPDDATTLEDGDGAGVERFWGPECGEGEPTNHGQYVSSQETGGDVRSEAAHSPCGKPLSSVNESDDEADNDEADNGEPEDEIEVPEVSDTENGESHAPASAGAKGGKK